MITHTDTLTLTDFAAVRQGRPLSNPITISLTPGTVLGIVGPNGVGKSSLLSALTHTGVEHTGEAHLGGTNLGALRARERATRLSLLPQDLSAPPEFLVRELVAVGARAAGRTDTASAVTDALTQLGIADLAERRFGTLSGGQQQLVQLARVLTQRTPVVVFDEPISALDLAHQHTVEATMRTLAQQGAVVIAALHDLSFTLNACSHALLLGKDGVPVFGRPLDVLSSERVLNTYGVETQIYTTPKGRRYLASYPAE